MRVHLPVQCSLGKAILIGFVFAGLAASLIVAVVRRDPPVQQDSISKFVGAKRCAECHQDQFQAWAGSTHGLAGGPASAESVISTFDGTVLQFKDAVVRLSIDASDAYWFEVAITNQVPQTFRADYVVGGGFMVGGGGQSYFSSFPDGTVRLLPFEWSNRDGPWFVQTRTNRWQPVSESISIFDCTLWPPHRVLGESKNFEQNCGNCHGSQITTRYDPVQKKHDTHFTSLSINCESCHGPGQRHIERVSNPRYVNDPDIGMPSLAVLDKDASINVCLQCHAVKQKLTDEPFLSGMDFEKHFTTKIHTEFTEEFHPDGRVRGFQYQKNHLYSDCYLSGSMTCVDCHDPHSLHYRDINGTELVGKFDDRQCTSCHAAKAEDITAHTFHQPDSKGSRCTACHMPFLRHPSIGPDLGFDRSDHTIASPRPAYDAALGLDNACSQCHRDMTVAQLDDHVQRWYGPLKPHKPIIAKLTQALGMKDRKSAEEALRHSGVPMAEVAAISHYLQNFVEPDVMPSPETLNHFRRYAASPDLDVQAMGMTALHLVQGRDATIAEELARRVRSAGDRAADVASRRLLALKLLAESWLEKGQPARAAVAFRKALELDSENAPARLGLAKSLFAMGRQDDALSHFRTAAELAPYQSSIQNNVGVYLVQGGLTQEASERFERAVETNRDDAQLLNNYGLSLMKLGEVDKAAEIFERVLAHDPQRANTHISLGSILESQGRTEDALACFKAAEKAQPNDINILMKMVLIHEKSRRAPEMLDLLRRAEILATQQFRADDPRFRDIRGRVQWLEARSQ
ncbi:MAG: Tfp pilus assembly protein PilF [Candidatus Promineifilaceae bacterium]|jgi:Tfp pilus assembly protein PilF